MARIVFFIAFIALLFGGLKGLAGALVLAPLGFFVSIVLVVVCDPRPRVRREPSPTEKDSA